MPRFPASVIIALAAAPAIAQQLPAQQDSVRREATAPLRDARIKEDKIPDILQKAALAPYSLKGMTTCKALGTEVAALTTALGPDVDGPSTSRKRSSELASQAAGAAVSTIVPGLGLVKLVTGADKQQKRVQAAVFAGAVRRGFLKGVGLSRKCSSPAAPSAGAIS